MIHLKKVLFSLVLGFLLFSLIACGNKNIGSSLTNLTTNRIDKVEVSSPRNQWSKSLTTEEISSLVKLLNDINKNNIKEYTGPILKGGPTSITIYMKSNKTLVLTMSGDSFLYGEGNKGYQVYQPDVSKFINQISSVNR